ncbi:MAG: hypothetical protein RL653_1542 [Pseudomonadota bacterium]|jgi:peptidoglycan hydrolase-like protein with peptidoglycan-binding domain
MPITRVNTGPSPAFSSGRSLSKGDAGQEVAQLQQLLTSAGFDPGPVDGQFGPMTEAAVLQFQRRKGISVDGSVGAETWGALWGGNAAPASAAATGARGILASGASGASVTKLQQALTAAGYDPGPVDGEFGPQTRAAVVRFQRDAGLVVDGLVAAQTWRALESGSFRPAPSRPSGGTAVGGPTGRDAVFRRRILEVAEGELGTVEATNNNDGAVGKYPAFFGRGREAYCADFVSWVMHKSGGSLNDPYCPSLRNKLIASGNWKGKSNPQPGDIVLFDWDRDGVADHVGLVKSVNANGTLTTLEGNTEGPGGREGVWECTRAWDHVMGFGDPM